MSGSSSQIKALRKRHALSTTELAYLLGVSQSTAVRLEQSEQRGAISINTLRKVAEALGYTFSYKLTKTKGVRHLRKRYAGKSRIKGTPALRRLDSINDELKSNELVRAATLSPSERVLEACALSDLGALLRSATPQTPKLR